MDLQSRKLSFIQEFLRLADEDVINKLEKILHFETKKKLAKQHIPITELEFQNMISKSEEDYKNGKYVEANELLKRFNS